jgi:hypothetical protein
MIRIALAPLLFLVAFTAPAQQMYRWVDEKGTTHFSEYPPPEGNAAKIEVKPTGTEKPRVDDWKERELESRQRRAAQGAAEDQARKKNEAGRAQNCRRAQQGLDTVKNSRRVYDLNDKGERVYLDDKDRPAEIARWTGEVEKYCR